MTNQDRKHLHRRLSRLGRSKGSAKQSGTSAANQPRGLPPGELLQTAFGHAFRIETHYALAHRHGDFALEGLLAYPGSLAAEVSRQPAFQDVSLSELVFVDTETTGLAGGAGTLVFLVGVGAFTAEGFRVRQYFLRDPAEEQSMLEGLRADLDQARGFVSYNGRAFDLPLLETRYTIAMRRRMAFGGQPHLDLLFPARKLWRHTLPDCRLATVEAHILGVRRTSEDVPGAWIPGMYQAYLRSGDASEMQRVIYHNEVDILSLVSLADQVLARHQSGGLAQLSEAEALAVACWHQDSGRDASAEQAFRKAIASSDAKLQREALRRYTQYLKRQDRKGEALQGWAMWHEIDPTDPQPCVELAMYYEWDQKDLDQARHWTLEAMQCLSHWPQDWRREKAWADLEHRLRRLQRKQDPD